MGESINPTLLSRQLLRAVPHLSRPQKPHSSQPLSLRKVGLCVSGGADSMALAYLLNTLRHPTFPNSRLFVPKAFIVDHGARPESHAEAIQVQNNLQNLGIDSDILSLKWAPNQLRSLLESGFEEAARWHRYRQIARAATKDGINDLFTGHHRDDQMESMLLRLVRSGTSNLLSFQGMAAVSSVPCCETVVSVRPRSDPRWPEPASSNSYFGVWSKDILIHETQAHAGMHLIRPLLTYTKNQILSTCKEFGIPYVEDKTNFDPRFTARNAIRSLRAHHNLPRALQVQSLEALQQSACSIANESIQESQRTWDRIARLHLWSHTGMLKVSFKRFQKALTPGELRGFSYTMARLFELASPSSSDDWPVLLDKQSTEKLLGYLRESQGSCPGLLGLAPISLQKAVLRPVVRDCDAIQNTTSFIICRQPMRLSEKYAATLTFQANHVLKNGKHYSHWVLWDHRFWIRISSLEENIVQNVVVRPYQPDDVSVVKATLRDSQGAYNLERLLADSAPGDIRFTIPVLTYHGKVVVFPTLQLSLVPESSLSYQCRFARSPRTAEFLSENVHQHPSRES